MSQIHRHSHSSFPFLPSLLMSCSSYEYVKSFELSDTLLPHTWIVVRIDGKSFHSFTKYYHFAKPNDPRGMDLMSSSAQYVMSVLTDCVLSYGQSDEFSFVFPPSCNLFDRRSSKLSSTVVSLFTSHYTFQWTEHFPSTPLVFPHLPSFDSRCVSYPTDLSLKDYLRWRQVDCHINNLYNYSLYALTAKSQNIHKLMEKHSRSHINDNKGNTENADNNGNQKRKGNGNVNDNVGDISLSSSSSSSSSPSSSFPSSHVIGELSPKSATDKLKFTNSSQKNEILFSFGINYNHIEERERKGTTIVWEYYYETQGEQQHKDKEKEKGLTKEMESGNSVPIDDSEVPQENTVDHQKQGISPPLLPSPSLSLSFHRRLSVLSCDIISDSFYVSHFGIIPFVDRFREEKKQKLKLHRQIKNQNKNQNNKNEIPKEIRKEIKMENAKENEQPEDGKEGGIVV